MLFDDFLQELTRLGIITDVVGVVLLSKGVFWRRNKNILSDSGAHMAYNSRQSKVEIAAKYETFFGVSIISLGFIMQYFGSRSQSPDIHIWYTIIWVVAWVIIAISLIKVIGVWADKTVEKLVGGRESSNNTKNR